MSALLPCPPALIGAWPALLPPMHWGPVPALPGGGLLGSLGVLKPVLSALLLPPVPALLLSAWGSWRLWRQRRAGLLLVLTGLVALWLSACSGLVAPLGRWLLTLPSPLSAADRAALRPLAGPPARAAVVILGGGLQPEAPEYDGAPMLQPRSLERLHYGLWLARQTGLPAAFTGGRGFALATARGTEAEAAAALARDTFHQPLRWVESVSRDTRENADLTVPLLAAAGVTDLVLVTHAWHMPRAQRVFSEAAARQQPPLRVHVAPMGLAEDAALGPLSWIPSHEGLQGQRDLWHEWWGQLLGV